MKKQVTIHPFLFAIFPTLYLYGTFHQYLDLSMAIRPAIVCIFIVCLSWMGLSWIICNSKRAAIPISLSVLAFFSYQAVSEAVINLLFNDAIKDTSTGSTIIAGSFFLALIGGTVCWRLRGHLDELTYLMNVIGTILVATPLVSMGIQSAVATRGQLSQYRFFDPVSVKLFDSIKSPDIYYIILDGYGRADYLREEYEFDNSQFVEYLRKQGFYVAERSNANYPQTILSIASSLNFDYLDKVLGPELRDVPERNYARQLVRHNRAVRMLRDAGYSVIAFASEFFDAEIADPDIYISEWWFQSLFETSVINMTPLPSLTARFDSNVLYDEHRKRVLYSFDRLGDMPKLRGPKFVYAHIFAGHPPFVFGLDGEEVNVDRPYSWAEGEKYRARPGASAEEYRKAYRAQLTFLNRRLCAAIDKIIKHSSQPPVIILQGDHGPGSELDTTSLDRTNARERYSILNAYYLPGASTLTSGLYPSISPVNTFRVVFNTYMGTDLCLLEDKCFFSPFDLPYQFTGIAPDVVQPKVR